MSEPYYPVDPQSYNRHSSFAYNAAVAAVTAPLVTVAYYPARDAAKVYGQLDSSVQHFFVSRWRGMATAPEIPLFVSLPLTATLLSYVATERLTGSSVLPSVVCGLVGGTARVAMRTYSTNIGRRRSFHGEYRFKSPMDCLRGLTAERGVGVWTQGCLATGFVHTIWYGGALRSIKWQVPQRQRSFFEDIFIATRTMTFWGVVTAPLRNATNLIVRNQIVEGTHRLSLGPEYAKNELSLLVRSAQMVHHIGMTDGLQALFRGSMMLVFKTNLHFGIFFATYRFLGGSF